jgi:hypothetical protein
LASSSTFCRRTPTSRGRCGSTWWSPCRDHDHGSVRVHPRARNAPLPELDFCESGRRRIWRLGRLLPTRTRCAQPRSTAPVPTSVPVDRWQRWNWSWPRRRCYGTHGDCAGPRGRSGARNLSGGRLAPTPGAPKLTSSGLRCWL